jgi:hypothetical protein
MAALNAGFSRRAAQFALFDSVLMAEVLARASFGESEDDASSRARCRAQPRTDPPRLGGWMSLSRIAQTSDVFLSPHRHRQPGSNPVASQRRHRLLRGTQTNQQAVA